MQQYIFLGICCILILVNSINSVLRGFGVLGFWGFGVLGFWVYTIFHLSLSYNNHHHPTMTTPVYQQTDEKFMSRLNTSILTVQAWDDDPTLLQECRLVLPWEDLRNETGPYADYHKDALRFDNPNIRFLQRLARYVQRDFMTWVNQPSCANCGSLSLHYQTSRGPETTEEVQGNASRVEVYECQACNAATTTFPRYNAPRKLLETRKGYVATALGGMLSTKNI